MVNWGGTRSLIVSCLSTQCPRLVASRVAEDHKASYMCMHFGIPYSRKIWRELNLAKSPKTVKIKYWRNLNLAIVYGEGYGVI